MVQSDAQKKAKAKYYAKLREDPQFMEKMAKRQKEYYENNNKKHLETVKRYFEVNKEQINEHNKQKRQEKKLNNVVSKLEATPIQDLAKILIETRKTKLLEIEV
jgi:hypothetical protein